jgi:hypothetical protein
LGRRGIALEDWEEDIVMLGIRRRERTSATTWNFQVEAKCTSDDGESKVKSWRGEGWVYKSMNNKDGPQNVRPQI